MVENPKIAVIGGGSTYTPELIEGLGLRAERLGISEIALHDIDSGRLDVVGGLAERILRKQGFAGRLVSTTERSRAIDGAAFVLVQLRVGGLAARLKDETIPPRFGCLGQETTGAGGFAKALRTVPVVLDIAAEMGARGGAGAWLLDFTNPAGLVAQALIDGGHRAIGLCNIPIGFQRQLADRLGVTPDRVSLEHVGLNHLSWERGVHVDGVDRLPGLIETFADQLGEDVDMPGDLIRLQRAIPSYYLRYFYFPEKTVADQATHPSRAEEVMQIEADLLEMYRDPALDVKPKLLEKRGGAFYSEAAAMLLESLATDRGDTQVVNVRNAGTLAFLPDEAVIEVPSTVGAAGAQPVPVAPLDPQLSGLVGHVAGYEELAVEAALRGGRDRVLAALLAHPLVGQYDLAGKLTDRLIAENRAYLPWADPAGIR